MRRPSPSDPKNHGTENHQRPNFPKNDVKPVPDIQGKAKHGHEKASPTQEELDMPKDSQPDNKKARKIKSRGQTPITAEAQNHNPNAKKQSIKNDDV